MKTYRQKSRSGISLDSKSSNVNGNAIGPSVGGQAVKGPDEEKIKEILERTGYTLDVTTGQRKFGGPPPGWEGEPPSNGCEVSYNLLKPVDPNIYIIILGIPPKGYSCNG